MKFIIPKRKNEYTYVGFNTQQNNAEFIFPCQYVKEDSTKTTDSEKRKEARKVLSLIKKVKTEIIDGGKKDELFQFNSMIWIIQNYIEKGYYFENQVIAKSNLSGKINWKKTIKNNSVWLDNGNIIYSKIFSNVKQIDDDAIVSEIYKYCLDIAIQNLGFVFGIEKTKKSIYSLKDINFMVYYLKNRCNNTFLDYKKLLFGHMLNILLNGKLQKGKASLFANDKEFEYVFEFLIDEIFGVKEHKVFNPTAEYVFEDGRKFSVKSLRPDTILEYEEREGGKSCCVIDAKYYSFNYDNNMANSLPAQSSINKQFIYQKFIENSIGKYKKVSSVFILPFCALEDEPKIQFMKGCAKAEWNDEKGVVYLFKADLKTLVDEFYAKSESLKNDFVKILQKELNNKVYF